MSLAAILGLTITTLGQLLLVAGVMSLATSFVVGALGIVPVIVWAGAQTYVGLRFGIPSLSAGWTLLVVLGMAALIAVSSAPGLVAATWTFTVAFLLAFVGYLAVIGTTLRAGRRVDLLAP